MLLKIGELAKRTGLSVRALHHYDTIGLLSPGRRSDGGARLYGRDDLIRLHRIEALKQLGCSLAEIKAALETSVVAPVETLRRQIDAVRAQAEQALRVGQHLQRLLDLVASGTETVAADWLDILELMNMYRKHLSQEEVDALLASKPGAVHAMSAEWTALIAQVREAMARTPTADDAAAQDLAWRWVRLVIRMTDNDPALSRKLMSMQLAEPRAQEILGITPAMIQWVGVALAHARTALFAKHMTPEQAGEVLRRQLANMAHMDRWPALVCELRAQMEAGVDTRAEPVQAIVARWQQLFRESYCGDDGALQARVREAFMHEPDLGLVVGMDEALLAYLQRAHIAAAHFPREGAGPKPSAFLVALQRAAHQLLERPLVLDDPFALDILGDKEAQALRADLDRYRNPMAQGLRSSVVVRSRLAEDEWGAAYARGVRQYVILGAGLDTSAHRHAYPQARVFEVDLPATQAWKRAHLQQVGIDSPEGLRYVPVDFETVSLGEGLAAAGFDAGAPAYFSWLGVTMYLEEASVIETLRFIAACARGSSVLFEYVVPFAALAPAMRIAIEQMAAQLAERGEPWKSFFDPEALARTVAALGFRESRTWMPDELNARYLANRTDALRIGAGPGRLMLATV